MTTSTMIIKGQGLDCVTAPDSDYSFLRPVVEIVAGLCDFVVPAIRFKLPARRHIPVQFAIIE